MLAHVLSELHLKEEYLSSMMKLLPAQCPVSKFITLLQTGGSLPSSGGFRAMAKKDH
jgi:hypothetical protein